MRMPGRYRPWLALLCCLAVDAFAESFSHTRGSEHFEAVVTDERVIVKERFQGASTIFGDLSCPLGPAVKASMLSSASSGLCLEFAKDRCDYTRYQNGVAIHAEELANARVPKMCIALASARDAKRFAALVNAGPQAHRQAAPEQTAPGATASAPAEPSNPARPEGAPAAPAAQRSAAPSSPSRPAAEQGRKTPRTARKSTSRTKSATSTRKAKKPVPWFPRPTPTDPAHAHE